MIKTKVEQPDGWWVFTTPVYLFLVLFLSLFIAFLIFLLIVFLTFAVDQVLLMLGIESGLDYFQYYKIVYVISYGVSIPFFFKMWKNDEMIHYILPKGECQRVATELMDLLNEKGMETSIVPDKFKEDYVQLLVKRSKCYISLNTFDRLKPPQTLFISVVQMEKDEWRILDKVKMHIKEYFRERNIPVHRDS